MDHIFDPVRTRFISCFGLATVRDWRLKLYTISHRQDGPAKEWVERGIAAAAEVLPMQTAGMALYGVGWLTVHEGLNGVYALVDWWADQDIVHHRLFGCPSGHAELMPNWPKGACFCAWELEICWHERQAWMRHVLNRHGAPDFEGYLCDQMRSAA